MSECGDPQDLAEALDDDKVTDRDDRDGWVESGTEYPPDRPMGVNAYGITAQEDKIDEPLDERVAHEQPDPLVEELDRAADFADRDDNDYDDVLGQEVGKLVGEDGWGDDEAEAVGQAVGDEDDLSAEESAVHVTADPAMDPLGDGYIPPSGNPYEEAG